MLQRRSFIKNTILATGALSLPFIGNAQNAATTLPAAANFKKAIWWGNIGIKGSILDKCKAVKEAGFQGVEPFSHLDRKEVIDALKSTGLGVTAVSCLAHQKTPISHPDAAVRQQGVEEFIIGLEDAKAYGTDVTLLVPGSVSNTVSYDEVWDRSTEGIKKLIPVAEKLKVMICVENVWNNFLLSPLEACRYVDQFNSPYVKLYFDIGNIVAYGWPEQWIKILGDRISRVHIKEFSRQIADRQGRWSGFNVKLTEGDVNWPKVIELLRNGYKGEWLTVEMEKNETMEELKDLSQRLDKVISM